MQLMPMPLAGLSYRQSNLPSDAATPIERLGGELHVLALPVEVDRDGRGVGRARPRPATETARDRRRDLAGPPLALGRRTRAAGGWLFQIVSPVILSSATSVASSPPGVQMTLSPSTSGDSR